MSYDEPPDEGLICDRCERWYPDANPVVWRFWDWFWSLRPCEAWLARQVRKDIAKEAERE